MSFCKISGDDLPRAPRLMRVLDIFIEAKMNIDNIMSITDDKGSLTVVLSSKMKYAENVDKVLDSAWYYEKVAKDAWQQCGEPSDNVTVVLEDVETAIR